MIKLVQPSCFGSNPSPQSQAENCCHDCGFQIRCLSQKHVRNFNEHQKANYASLAIMWQQLAASSAMNARKAMRDGEMRMAAYYQREAARDHKQMWEYLRHAI